MCRIKTPSVPAAPSYAPAPEPVQEEPKLDTEDKTLSNDTADQRARRRGARALRTDLGIGSRATGLGVPNG